MTNFLTRLCQLAGADIATKLVTEFSGDTVYIPNVPERAKGKFERELYRRNQRDVGTSKLDRHPERISFWSLQMTYQGIDMVDGTRPSGPGIGVGSRRAHVRKLCLDVIDQSRPGLITESGLLACIRSVYPDADRVELRRALSYLEISGLLKIKPTTVLQPFAD